MTTSDPFNLVRFVEAQEHDYENALREIRNGRKTGHWIWYIFPQMKGLGFSSMSQYYGIGSADEARAYLNNAILKERLFEITKALLQHEGQYAETILGYVDAMKVRSCMTLFDFIEPDSVFAEVLDVFYNGERDAKTLEIIRSTSKN